MDYVNCMIFVEQIIIYLRLSALSEAQAGLSVVPCTAFFTADGYTQLCMSDTEMTLLALFWFFRVKREMLK